MPIAGLSRTGSQAFLPGSTTPFFTPQTTQGNQAWAVFRSGDDFGRLLWSVRLIGTLFSGTGVYNDAHQATASFQASYAVNRMLAVLGEIGYEDARYSGRVPYIVKEMTWGIGARAQFDPDSALIAAVRQRDGFISPFADVAVSIGARTRLNGNYREVLSTTGVQSLDLLNAITYDALGNPIDRFSGSPIVIPFAGTPIGAMGGPLDGGLLTARGRNLWRVLPVESEQPHAVAHRVRLDQPALGTRYADPAVPLPGVAALSRSPPAPRPSSRAAARWA